VERVTTGITGEIWKGEKDKLRENWQKIPSPSEQEHEPVSTDKRTYLKCKKGEQKPQDS